MTAARVSLVVFAAPRGRRSGVRVEMANLTPLQERRVNRACDLVAVRRRVSLAELCNLVFAALDGTADVVEVTGAVDYSRRGG